MLGPERLSPIVVIAPHADDEVLGAGGVIARALGAGANTHVIFMAVGPLKHWGLPESPTSTERLAEIEAVAKRLGFSYELFSSDEEKIERLDTLAQQDLVDYLEDAYNRLRPGLLLLPHGEDFDQDHRATYTAACAAARPIPQSLNKFFPANVMTYEMPKVWASPGFRPSFYVDITTSIEDKLDALRLYATQLRERPHLRAPENVRALAHLRGSEIGVDYAEAFSVHRAVWDGSP
jgi:LmbE family N-acetylglucosaminyl deacetylase